MAKKRVLWWGRFDPGYSRNRVYISLFKKLGWEVDFFFVKLWPRFGDVESFFRGLQFREKPDLVWVPVARQRDILAACRWVNKLPKAYLKNLEKDGKERVVCDYLSGIPS